MTVTFMGGCESQFESFGLAIIQRSVYRLRDALGEFPRPAWVPEGPHFLYETGPELFGGRSGRGPLKVLMDTNIVIEYFKHGATVWLDAPAADDEPGEELEALQLLLALWAMRDVRFYLPTVLRWDFKKPLNASRRRQRSTAIREFGMALQLADDPEPAIDLKFASESRLLKDILRAVPAGPDRAIAREALLTGMHVLLTNDKGIRRAAADLRGLGLLVASPQELLTPLFAAGAFHCMLVPECAYWPLPDQHRVSHLVRVLLTHSGRLL